MSAAFHQSIATASKEQQTICAGKGDVLRPAHVKAYHSLLHSVHPDEITWLTMELCHKVCEEGAGSLGQHKDAMNALLARITTEGHGNKVHIWAKGLCAFIILTSPFAPEA
jgi:hypothetical protein